MAEMIVHPDKISDTATLAALCPFGAIEVADGHVRITSACRMCKLCVKNGPPGAFELVNEKKADVDKSAWRGVAVYIDQTEGEIHPVSLELLGKARELAQKVGHPVYALLAGDALGKQAEALRHYGVDKIYLYGHPQLAHFRIEPYAAVFEDFIKRSRPAVVLVGGTAIGRSLAPRVAARFHTGLTADCTCLDIQSNTDLDQIRPAFGGNIMAHIRTPHHRPQFATVRYKIFSAPERLDAPRGEILSLTPEDAMLASRIETLATHRKEPVKNIEDADVLVVAGLGIQRRENLEWLERLAGHLGGMVGGTRPVIEAGWLEPRRQIGLSGRTVKPKLLIACGVSGSIQFVAGMSGAEQIMAINIDPLAPIFKVAHTALVGDVCEIVPALLNKIENGALSHV
ncbi:MAG TPA: electron transfer flavoprotein subunit alpha [Kiritimatiellia bacterium]|nr:electron transfer flavoprotein subunit alpha [Kiritimatiellia bacterium]HPS09482.1 electron transfer flavoprotein subunit alpha [Kiritimatiellia bacterium]